MSIKSQLFEGTVHLLQNGIQLFGKKRAGAIYARLADQPQTMVTLETHLGPLKFYCPNTRSLNRARHALTREPQTIEWIRSLPEGDCFWDVGANIGVFSLYAALHRMTVVAFEPSPFNYSVLSKNIKLNQMDQSISAFCVALNHETKLDYFHMANAEAGGALNQFGNIQPEQEINSSKPFSQSAVGFTLDEFLEKFRPPFPNHIKIDVDGNENKIIDGALKTFSDAHLKSVMIELSTEREDYPRLLNTLKSWGLELYRKDPASQNVEHKFSAVCNHLFQRG